MERFKIAPFLLIPFIENSFKHSLGTKAVDVKIDIEVRIIDEQLTLATENNFEKNTASSKSLMASGIGLENVQKRLQLLYPQKHELKIKESNETYKIRLVLNLN